MPDQRTAGAATQGISFFSMMDINTPGYPSKVITLPRGNYAIFPEPP